MKGDFSRWRTGADKNFNGVLPQQGKVLLDSDGIAQTMLGNDWQQTAGQDWVGTVAGVPQSAPDSFLVTDAVLPAGGAVTLTVDTGRLWADGLLVRLADPGGASSVTRTAAWLEPPIVPNAGSAVDVADGVVDAVVLEVWQRAVNGFALPDDLIEPALGGPDTAERLQTECAFRLARLAPGQTCTSLTYDDSSLGTLNVALVPSVTSSGDCPLNATGGYSGFEHQFYRVEIADTNAAFKEFKWSRINGGLVGRGSFDPATQMITIDANTAAINSSNETVFYLEIEDVDIALGFTRVIAGAKATLNSGVLQLDAAPHFGTYPGAVGDVFFRLWNGIAAVSAYPVVTTPTLPTLLENGIQLQFAAEAAASYFSGDYWTFPLRAQGIANPTVLIASEPPAGIRYHRVSLAEITWQSDGAGGFNSQTIDDCREPIYPLTQRQGCCTHRVGDDLTSFGEFTSIQAAIDKLPPWGGEVCILPGRYFENVIISGQQDIVIHGCGWQTRVASASLGPKGTHNAGRWAGKYQKKSGIPAVFTVVGSAHIKFHSFAVEAAVSEAGILIDGADEAVPTGGKLNVAGDAFNRTQVGVFDTTIEEMVITAAKYPAILAVRATQLVARENRILMSDQESNWPAAFFSGRQICIEGNLITLQSLATVKSFMPLTVFNDLGNIDFSTNVAHPGGIQIGGPSSSVSIVENEIVGGTRNGITLGSIDVLGADGFTTGVWWGVVLGSDNCCTGGLTITGTTTPGAGETYVNAGPLKNINIERNIVAGMGLCGIGPVAWFDLTTQFEVISIEDLSIIGNTITDTVQRAIDISKTTPATALMGHAAVTVPDVVSLTIRDNVIRNFGQSPGLQVSGIFVLLCQGIEISRNQITETRDWSGTSIENANPSVVAGGIIILLATPPLFDSQTLLSNNPTFEPGVSSVRIAENTVRVALGQGLIIFGLGPMAIVNNHFATGGPVANSTLQLAQTVSILNWGTGVELTGSYSSKPSEVYGSATGKSSYLTGKRSRDFTSVSSGTVLFGSNICQLEARENGETEIASVLIFTPDTLIFSNNESWLDAARPSAFTNILLIAGVVQAIANRLQEGLEAALISGITLGGAANITTQNVATKCLLAAGAQLQNTGNIVLIDAGGEPNICAKIFQAWAVANT